MAAFWLLNAFNEAMLGIPDWPRLGLGLGVGLGFGLGLG